MRGLIASLLGVLACVATADARLFERPEDCTCTNQQHAASFVLADSGQPSSADLAKLFPVRREAARPRAEAAPSGSIKGTAALTDDANAVYTVICLPRNYRTCQHCMETLNAMSSDADMAYVRGQSRYYVLVDGTPRFSNLWRSRVPEVGRGATVVILMQGNHVLHREVAPVLSGFGDRFKKKLCDKFCPDCNKPAEPPVEEPQPEEPPVIQPPIVPPPVAKEETNPALIGLTMLGVGFVVWGVMFRRGM